MVQVAHGYKPTPIQLDLNALSQHASDQSSGLSDHCKVPQRSLGTKYREIQVNISKLMPRQEDSVQKVVGSTIPIACKKYCTSKNFTSSQAMSYRFTSSQAFHWIASR